MRDYTRLLYYSVREDKVIFLEPNHSFNIYDKLSSEVNTVEVQVAELLRDSSELEKKLRLTRTKLNSVAALDNIEQRDYFPLKDLAEYYEKQLQTVQRAVRALPESVMRKTKKERPKRKAA